MTIFIYVAVIRMIMMPSCPYFIFIDTSISKHVDIFFDFGFSLEDQRGLSLGELIRPFCIMLLYQYLLHYGLLLHIISQYLGYSLLFYKVYHEEGECRQLEFWLEKEQILETDLYYTTFFLQTLLGLQVHRFVGEQQISLKWMT